MLDKQISYRGGRDKVAGVQAELSKVGILANQVSGRILQFDDRLQQCCAVERRLKVLHDLGRGSGLFGFGQRVFGRRARGVVQDRDGGHTRQRTGLSDPPDTSLRAREWLLGSNGLDIVRSAAPRSGSE